MTDREVSQGAADVSRRPVERVRGDETAERTAVEIAAQDDTRLRDPERRGIFRGREGARELARLLERELPHAPYTDTNRLVAGRVAFLEWTAEAAHSRVRDGAASFVIEDGWIVAQTIHYTVEAAR